MEADAAHRYALEHDGRLLVVEVGTEEAANVARLLVDGAEAARGRTWRVGAVTLRHDDLSVAVSWWWTGRVRACDLVEKPAEGSGRPHRTMLEPPPDTRAHRLWELQQEKPGLYA